MWDEHHLRALSEMPQWWWSRSSSMLWSMVSKATLISRKRRVAASPESAAQWRSSKRRTIAVSVEYPRLYADWRSGIMSKSEQCCSSCRFAERSTVFERKSAFVTGRYELRSFGSSEGFLRTGETRARFREGGK